MNKRCMKLGHVSHDDTCPDAGDSDHGSGYSGWDGDWGLGGDEVHCHGDSCTVCDPGEVGSFPWYICDYFTFKVIQNVSMHCL